MEGSVCSSTRDPSFCALTEAYKNTEETLSVVVISTADICKKLKESLLEYQKIHGMEYHFKLYVHIADGVIYELCNRNVHVDFFIMLADPRRADVVKKMTKDLQKLPPQFLVAGKCVIVVAWPEAIPPSMVATCSASVHRLCNKYMLHKIVQQVPGASGEKRLADQLLRLARTSRGLTASGVPNFTGCFYPGQHSSDNEETDQSTDTSESDD